jgi:tetratricopeptide (TPR) repeat protein/transcriptional regulator with XRE-family HTH domain
MTVMPRLRFGPWPGQQFAYRLLAGFLRACACSIGVVLALVDRGGMVVAEPPVVTFAGLLRQFRTEAGLTQEELAVAAGLSTRAVSDLERGVALTARKDTARLLADALGLSGAARASFEAVARGRALAGVSPAPSVKVGGVAAATRTLPRDIASFTGRESELQQLVDVTAATSDSAGVVGIHAIGGMAGIGKTTFAVHAAHQLAPRFPDGQIFLPLHGHTPGQQPVDPSEALASLLLTAGAAAGQIPPGLEARTALWRDHLAGKQLLLLLDDAADSEQVRPLLPGTSGSLVLVTSRRHLTALDDAQAVSLDTLSPAEAAELLIRLAARPGLHPGDVAVAEITRLCGCLPLAVGMLARQLHHHPAWTVAGLAADLTATRDRLELLHTENLSVAAAFDLSYADLSADQQRLFRRLGLHPGADIDAYAAAALDGTDLPTARRNLEGLYQQYLITEPARGRYRLHDLIREHARNLAATDPQEDQDAATSRLSGYYIHTVLTARNRINHQLRPEATAAMVTAPGAVPDFRDYARAVAWAWDERANLLACLDQTIRTGQNEWIAALITSLAGLLEFNWPWVDAATPLSTAIRAARQLDDKLWEATALDDLATVRVHIGDQRGATDALERALNIYRDIGNRLGQAYAFAGLGLVRRMADDYPGALLAQEEALSIYRELGSRRGEAYILNTRGLVRGDIGDYEGGINDNDIALGILRDLGDRYGEARALFGLGEVQRYACNYPAASSALEEALGIFDDLGDRSSRADVLISLGAVRRDTGDFRGAAQALEEAMSICRDVSDRGDEATALNETGTLHRLRGDLERARGCHRQSLALAREMSSCWDEAHALAGLARCDLASGQVSEAHAGLRRAWAIFHRIGAAAADGVAAELDALTESEPASE